METRWLGIDALIALDLVKYKGLGLPTHEIVRS